MPGHRRCLHSAPRAPVVALARIRTPVSPLDRQQHHRRTCGTGHGPFCHLLIGELACERGSQHDRPLTIRACQRSSGLVYCLDVSEQEWPGARACELPARCPTPYAHAQAQRSRANLSPAA
eukprot:scaffold64630_cov30-Tisochrysis_lutea.AAC.5